MQTKYIWTFVVVVIAALIVIGYKVSNSPESENSKWGLSAEDINLIDNKGETMDVREDTHDELMADILAKNGGGNPVVLISTSMGDIRAEILLNESPITASNFLKLVTDGYYEGIKFHRVMPNFMVQAGDPNTKTDDLATYGSGGPGYTIKDEFVEGLSNVRGTIAMANRGYPDFPNSGGSQFFINVVDNTGLDWDKFPPSSKHPVFGKVIEGMDVADQMSTSPTRERDIPVEPIVINSITIE